MIVDNTEQIKKLIDNCGPGEFYMLNILHRGKDGKTPYEPADKKISQQMIKTYYVSSAEYLEHKMPEIRDLCHLFNARAVINLNKKSWKRVALESISILTSCLMNEDKEAKWWKDVKSVIDSACGQTGACDGNKVWLVDLDSKDENQIELIKSAVNQCPPFNYEDKVVAVVPTKSGYHILTHPFNKMDFKKLYPEKIDIHENNPTVLYAFSNPE